MPLSFERNNAGAFVLETAGAMPLSHHGKGRAVLPESKNMSKQAIGVPQELGSSCRLHGISALGLPNPKTPGSRALRPGLVGANTRRTVVPPSEGNEVRRDGCRAS